MKTCPKCGNQLPDDAAFCNNCGEKMTAPAADAAATTAENVAPVPVPAPAAAPAGDNTASTNNNGAPVNNATLEAAQQKSKNSQIGIIAVAAAAVILVVILIVVLSSALGGGYKAPIKNLVNNFNRGNTNVEDYLSCVAPKFAVSTYSDVYDLIKSVDKDVIEDFDEEVKDSFEEFFDEAEDTFGKDYRLSYEIKDAERLDKDEIEDLQEVYEDLFDMIDDNIDYEDEDIYEDLADELEDYYDLELSNSQITKLRKIVISFMDNLDNFKIQDAYEVKLKLVIEGKDDSEKTTVTIYVIKVNGQWFIDPNSLMSSMGGSSITSTLSSLLWYYF